MMPQTNCQGSMGLVDSDTANFFEFSSQNQVPARGLGEDVL